MVNYETVGEFYHKLIQEERVSSAIGANGLPLNVVGKVNIPVRLGGVRTRANFHCCYGSIS